MTVPEDVQQIVQSWLELLNAAHPPAPGTVLQLPLDLQQALLRYC